MTMYKKMMLLFVVLLAAGIVAPNQATAQNVDDLKFPKLNKLEIPDVEKVTLDNGMRLYLLVDKSLPIFRTSMRINCGSYLEPSDKIGLASMVGTVLRTGGTSKWTGDEIDEILEAFGGSVETSVGLASGSAGVNVLSEYTSLGLEVLAEILRRPVFDDDKIDLAKVQERSGISRRNDDAMQIAFREYRKIIYGAESVYARQVEYATIDAITREDLIAYHAKYYKPQNVQMAIWGDFDKKTLLAEIDKWFGDWKMEGDSVPSLPEVDYTYDNQVYYINKPDVNQSNVVLGHIGGLTSDADYADRIVMNNVLGGGFGSRLFSSVRSKEGLAYATFGVYTANISYPGVFYAFASTKSETTVKAAREVIKQIKLMQTDPPTEDEMRMGKDGYLNSFVFNFDSKAEIVNRLMRYDFYGLPDDFLFTEKENVQKVTPEAVMAAAQKNLRPDALRILVVGKGEDFEMPLDQAGLGNVTTIDITIPSAEEKHELAITPENIEKGKELLDKAVASAGGLENFQKVKAVSMKGKIFIVTPNGEFPVPFESLNVFPDKSRTVMNMMGTEVADIRDGAMGWKMMETGQMGPKSEEDLLKEDKESMRQTIRLFQVSDDPPYQTVYDGSGDADGTPVEFVAILDSNGDQIVRLGLDPNSFQIVCKVFHAETPSGEGTIWEYATNFVVTDGMNLPMSREWKMNGAKAMAFEFTEILINPEVPADAFAKPE